MKLCFPRIWKAAAYRQSNPFEMQFWHTGFPSSPVQCYSVPLRTPAPNTYISVDDCDRSCILSGIFSDARWQGSLHLRHGPALTLPSAFDALLLNSRCCGFYSVYRGSVLGKSTHPLPQCPGLIPARRSRHNFGRGYNLPIRKPISIILCGVEKSGKAS